MPASLQEIIAEADRLLQPQSFEDYCPNGLQVPGAERVQTIVTAVSAQAELFERAAQLDAELILAHHGLFWGAGFQTIDPLLKRRLQILFDADISLAAYHLPLDAHPELGNNALLARGLEAQSTEPFGRVKGQTIGCLATFAEPGPPASELIDRVAALTEREPLALGRGPSQITRLAIVSGSGSDHIHEAKEAGAQALLTGEPAERVTAIANELCLHVIAAGHYATETFGIRSLGEHLADRFGLTHQFVDLPNPV